MKHKDENLVSDFVNWRAFVIFMLLCRFLSYRLDGYSVAQETSNEDQESKDE